MAKTKRPKLPSTRTPRSRTDYGSKAKKTQAKRIGKRGKSKSRKGFAVQHGYEDDGSIEWYEWKERQSRSRARPTRSLKWKGRARALISAKAYIEERHGDETQLMHYEWFIFGGKEHGYQDYILEEWRDHRITTQKKFSDLESAKEDVRDRYFKEGSTSKKAVKKNPSDGAQGRTVWKAMRTKKRFTIKQAAKATGMSETKARTGIDWLRRYGYVQPMGESYAPSRGSFRVNPDKPPPASWKFKGPVLSKDHPGAEFRHYGEAAKPKKKVKRKPRGKTVLQSSEAGHQTVGYIDDEGFFVAASEIEEIDPGKPDPSRSGGRLRVAGNPKKRKKRNPDAKCSPIYFAYVDADYDGKYDIGYFPNKADAFRAAEARCPSMGGYITVQKLELKRGKDGTEAYEETQVWGCPRDSKKLRPHKMNPKSKKRGAKKENPRSARPQGQVRSPSDRRSGGGRGRGVSDAEVKARADNFNSAINRPDIQRVLKEHRRSGTISPYFFIENLREISWMSTPQGHSNEYRHYAKQYPGWKYGDFKLLLASVDIDKVDPDHRYPELRKAITRAQNPKSKASKSKASKSKTSKSKTSKSKASKSKASKSKTKKVPWSASDIKGMQEFADRKTGSKKKAPANNWIRVRRKISRGHILSLWRGPILSKSGSLKGDDFASFGDYYWEIQHDEDADLWELYRTSSKPVASSGTKRTFSEKDDEYLHIYGPWYSARKGRFSSFQEAEGKVPKRDAKHWITKPGAKAKRKATKKATKKKATRKKTSPYQLLINRCQKLWTHYCERPSKKRLEVLYVHLDKMKESTSKKAATERSRCLRAANAEAKKLKYKRE